MRIALTINSPGADLTYNFLDIICKLAGMVSVTGGKGRVVEFFGPGVEHLEQQRWQR